MLALSPPLPLFSSAANIIGSWPFEEPSSEALFHQFYSQSESEAPNTNNLITTNTNTNTNMVIRKLNHNASERDRRKKINALYSSLRSLLPLSDQTRKLSIPATISRVLKYIPELKQQVEGLSKKKEQILERISQQGGINSVNIIEKSQRKIPIPHHHHHHHKNSNGFVISTSRLNDNEVTVHVSCYNNKVLKNSIPLSEILVSLEKDGFVLLNVSSSHTFGDMLFYNLHFQVDKFQRLDSEIVTEKLLLIMENKEGNILVK